MRVPIVIDRALGIWRSTARSMKPGGKAFSPAASAAVPRLPSTRELATALGRVANDDNQCLRPAHRRGLPRVAPRFRDLVCPRLARRKRCRAHRAAAPGVSDGTARSAVAVWQAIDRRGRPP